MEKVSIIIPGYNCEKYIADTLESINKQDYENLEVVFVDDGSKDNTAKIVKNYIKGKEKFTYLFQENQGAPAARNKGFLSSTGRYVVFFDADDIMNVNEISLLYNAVVKDNSDIAIGTYSIIDKDGMIIGKDKSIKKREKINSADRWNYSFLPPFPDNKMYDSKIIRENELNFDDVVIGQDLNFFLKYLLHCDKGISLITESVCKYRITPNSITRTYTTNKIYGIVETFNKIKQYYLSNGYLKEYEKYINLIQYFHYYGQLDKIFKIKDKQKRNEIYDFFVPKMKQLEINKHTKMFKMKLRYYLNIKNKIFLKKIYTSNFYFNFINRKERS